MPSTLRILIALLAAALLLAACKKNEPTPMPTPAPTEPAKKAPVLAPLGASTLLRVSAEDFNKRCDADLKAVQTGLDAFKKLDARAHPDDVLDAFDALQAQLNNAAARVSVAREAHPEEAVRKAAEACEQQLEKLSTEMGLDRGVYDVLSLVKTDGRDEATKTWLKRALRDMRRLGVDRDEATRAKVKELNDELTKLGQSFARAIRADTRTVELKAKQLDGLPEDFKRAHPADKKGIVKVTTDTPDYMPVLTYAKAPAARKALWTAYRQRAEENLKTLPQLIEKRAELATLLGYDSWAAYVTETKMVETVKHARAFIDEVTTASEAPARAEYDLLLALKKRDFPKAKDLDPWDFEFYEDRYKAQTFGFDSQAVRPYLEYTSVLEGVLSVTSKMFGIRYEPVKDAQTWHESVLVYDVYDGETRKGRIYLDMHPREGKYKHAAQFELVVGQKDRALPEGVLMCNFPKPGAEPALMQPREVETFFHEFGHLLHHVLGGDQRWAAVSGVKTEWDFVEAPSMLLQEWAHLPESLAVFAKHYETKEPIPDELVKKMVAATEFGKALYTRRQMFLSALALEYYDRKPGFDTTKVGWEVQQKFEPFRREFVEGTHFQTTFGHLDGYSAAYYTYIWSSVIARDLLSEFKKSGVMNPEPATRYRKKILEAGGSRDAALLVKDFLGRDYAFQAYADWLKAGATPPPSP